MPRPLNAANDSSRTLNPEPQPHPNCPWTTLAPDKGPESRFPPFGNFDAIFDARRREADEFYAEL